MNHDSELNRRDFFHWGVRGLAATALTSLLCRDQVLRGAEFIEHPHPHYPPKARRAIHICLVGGLSHVDSFDYKPNLEKFHGHSLQADEKPDVFFGKVGLLRKNDWAFAQRGQSGLWISDLFPNIARCADQLTLIRSMYSESANHTPALFLANSGFQFNGFPSVGSWLVYGLGSESDSLPAYVVLPDGRGDPNTGASTWTNGFLPAQVQGVRFGAGPKPVPELFPAQAIDPKTEAASRRLLRQLNPEDETTDRLISARLRNYALAARMQLSVPDVADLSHEPESIRRLYGIDRPETADTARRCLLGRRLLEQGVRFVQIFSGGPIAGNPRTSWDAHESVTENHGSEARRIDQPVAALLVDLKQRGMLEDTLVLFTTEFGRTPFTESAADQVGLGRDHNKYGFSIWMAGAGLKPGLSYGATDEVGWKAVEQPLTWHDFHATVLHLLGIDHERLTYYHNGIARRLTNVHGEVAKGILA
jgi:hypothetical protein